MLTVQYEISCAFYGIFLIASTRIAHTAPLYVSVRPFDEENLILTPWYRIMFDESEDRPLLSRRTRRQTYHFRQGHPFDPSSGDDGPKPGDYKIESSDYEELPSLDELFSDASLYKWLSSNSTNPKTKLMQGYLLANRLVPAKFIDDGFIPFLRPKSHDNRHAILFGNNVFLSQIFPIVKSMALERGIGQPSAGTVRVDKKVWNEWENDMSIRKSKLYSFFEWVQNGITDNKAD